MQVCGFEAQHNPRITSRAIRRAIARMCVTEAHERCLKQLLSITNARKLTLPSLSNIVAVAGCLFVTFATGKRACFAAFS